MERKTILIIVTADLAGSFRTTTARLRNANKSDTDCKDKQSTQSYSDIMVTGNSASAMYFSGLVAKYVLTKLTVTVILNLNRL